MTVFLSTFVNRIDKKGRVSVPASFRAVLGPEAPGIVIFRSLQYKALDGCSVAHLELLSRSLERTDLPPETYELIETTIFGGSVQIPIDKEGRITVPSDLADDVGISEEVAFVGRNKTFQLWDPIKLISHLSEARATARAQDISLSKIIAQATRHMGSSET